MRFSIRQFSIGMFLLFTGIIYALFAKYYFEQREQIASVIMSSIKNDISELSYILSRHIKKESIYTSRALLDRKSANNDYIRAIAVFDDKKLLLTTDPLFSRALGSAELFIDSNEDIYTRLTKNKALEENIYYYERQELKHYTLLLFIDHESVRHSFTRMREQLFMLFVFIPLTALLLFAYIIHKVVSRPLEMLRRYAYYQSSIPQQCVLKEIEYIRASMVQTFSRLEKERLDLYNLSRTDTLSGLSNRNHLQERVEQIIAQSKRNSEEFALLFLDLDHFKSINDSLGHDVGDELLRNVARVIHDILRVNDVVARIGGDEFVIVLTSYQDNIELIEIIDRIQERVMRPWQIQTLPINITSSIGIAIYPKDGKDLLSLMKNADIAMYEAKESGRRQYSFFTQELNQKTQDYITLTNTMKEALEKREYTLFYQPQNDVQTGKITGAEALIRWIDPEEGMRAPNTFIPVAEQNGFIIELGKWILETAIAQKKEWENRGINIKLSINVAAKQIQQDNFLETLEKLLQKYQVDASQIALEITESIFLHNSQAVNEAFISIKKLGVDIALDDFGTGYSSLSYLKDFPLDCLKIDKAFLDNYDSSEGAIFVKTIVKMAQTLQLSVLAEGVESKEQIAFLKSLNCDFYQGYVCSQPIDAEAFEKLYRSQ
mgnify:CR=1 FL=1